MSYLQKLWTNRCVINDDGVMLAEKVKEADAHVIAGFTPYSTLDSRTRRPLLNASIRYATPMASWRASPVARCSRLLCLSEVSSCRLLLYVLDYLLSMYHLYGDHKGTSINLLRDPNTSLVGARNPHPDLSGLRFRCSVRLVFSSFTTMYRGAHN